MARSALPLTQKFPLEHPKDSPRPHGQLVHFYTLRIRFIARGKNIEEEVTLSQSNANPHSTTPGVLPRPWPPRPAASTRATQARRSGVDMVAVAAWMAGAGLGDGRGDGGEASRGGK